MAGTVDKPLADVGDPGAVTLKGKRQERPSAPADDRTLQRDRGDVRTVVAC